MSIVEEHKKSSNAIVTEVQNIATYQAPGILATLNGQPVRLIATGDAPGHSPVCQYVNAAGNLTWAEQAQFTVIDSQFLPPNREALTDVLRSLTNTKDFAR